LQKIKRVSEALHLTFIPVASLQQTSAGAEISITASDASGSWRYTDSAQLTLLYFLWGTNGKRI